MSLPLLHSPADIARWLLVAKLAVGDPTTNPLPSWPCYNDLEPTGPDDCVTTYDHEPTNDGRSMVDGESFQHYGMQVRVRSSDAPTGRAKAEAIANVMAEGTYQVDVGIGTAVYRVQCFAKIPGVTRIGVDSPSTNRNLFVINALISLSRTS